ncbi:MAG: helix-turn-helix domain-containing protein [Actinomycetota bacterium]|nr:helix-turn-helix domain-containing protein [Actinomycetota bacterium]
MSVEDAGAALGLGRSAAYEAARRGELPTIRLGRRLVCPTAALRRLLCLDEPTDRHPTQDVQSPPSPRGIVLPFASQRRSITTDP